MSISMLAKQDWTGGLLCQTVAIGNIYGSGIFFCYNKLSQSNIVLKIFCGTVRYFLSFPVVCSYGHDLEFDYVTFLAFREEKQANANQIYSQAVLSIAI